MKKFKKKISKILKAFLALSLLFNSLMPLSTVFAMENEPSDEVILNVDTDTPEEEKEVTLEGENNEEEETPSVGETNEGDVTTEEETPTETPTEGEAPTEEVTFAYEVYVDDAKYEDDFGIVELTKDAKKVDIIAKISGAETTDDYKFTIGEAEYTTETLLNGVVVRSYTFDGYLYGFFDVELDGSLIDPSGTNTEEWMHYIIQYGNEEDNDIALSAVNSDYVFAEGIMTTTKYDEDTLVGIVKEAFPNVTATFEDGGLLLSDDHEVYVWYGIVTKGDVNGDGKINQEDLELLVKQILGTEEANEASDINGDGEVDDLDAAQLKVMLETGYTDDVEPYEEVTIDAKFDDFSNPVKVGEEFTLNYIVSLSDYTINGLSGLVKYDKNLLELVSAEANFFTLGDMNNDKFLYLGEYLDLDIDVEYDEEGNVVLDEDGMPKLIINDVEYVVLNLTFKALAEGETSVLADGVRFYDYALYYQATDNASVNVTIEGEVEPEEESPFESITVSGYEVDLNNYTVTVPNDVTALDLEYVLANENVTVSSVSAPDELAEGENTIVITLIDEFGEEKTYTITVTREASEENKEETNEEVAPVNYDEPDEYEEPDTEPDAKPTPSDDEKEEPKEADNGKLSRAVIIVLILLAIAGLIYLIFKDDKDDEETKKANRDIDKMKKEDDKKIKQENDKKVKKKGR